MTENFILLKTERQQQLENILFDLANLYSDTEYVRGMQLFRKKGEIDSFLVRFTNSPDFERFNYFTNYLVYPIDHPDFKPIVRGFYLTADIKQYPQLNRGRWVMVFVNENDENCDNVYLVNEDNRTFIYDFGGNLKALVEAIHEYRDYNIDLKNYHHIIEVFPTKTDQITEVKPWWKFW